MTRPKPPRQRTGGLSSSTSGPRPKPPSGPKGTTKAVGEEGGSKPRPGKPGPASFKSSEKGGNKLISKPKPKPGDTKQGTSTPYREKGGGKPKPMPKLVQQPRNKSKMELDRKIGAMKKSGKSDAQIRKMQMEYEKRRRSKK